MDMVNERVVPNYLFDASEKTAGFNQVLRGERILHLMLT